MKTGEEEKRGEKPGEAASGEDSQDYVKTTGRRRGIWVADPEARDWGRRRSSNKRLVNDRDWQRRREKKKKQKQDGIKEEARGEKKHLALL